MRRAAPPACAVGGTINEDDHVFGLSAAKKYGGIFVPPHEAVIHSYMREMIVKGGSMAIVSDSHTRYGSQGCLAIGEGGPEVAKAMLSVGVQMAGKLVEGEVERDDGSRVLH